MCIFHCLYFMPSSHEPCLKVLSLTLEEELYIKVIFIDEWGLREAKLPQLWFGFLLELAFLLGRFLRNNFRNMRT